MHKIYSRGKHGQYVTMNCCLCSSESPTNVYRKPSAWSEQHWQWVNGLCTNLIPLDITVCRACKKFIRWHTSKTDVVPWWLPAHTAGHVEMPVTERWKHSCHFFLICITGSPLAIARRDWSPMLVRNHQSRYKRSESSDRNCESGKRAGIDRLPCSYLYRSSHWIGMSTSGLHPCCCR